MPEYRLYDVQGRQVDEMRAPAGKPTFLPRDGQASLDRVTELFFEGVKLLVEDGTVWAYVRGRRQPSACTEQYYATVAFDDRPSVPDRVDALTDRLGADDRLRFERPADPAETTLQTFAETDPASPSFGTAELDPAAFGRRLALASGSKRTVRVAAPGPQAAYRGLVHWADRVDSAVVATDTHAMASGNYHLAVELGHGEWAPLEPTA